MGNNVTINDIDSAVQHLAHRNYPETFAQDGTQCGKIQICIPDIYLLNKHGAKFIQSDKKSVKVDCQQFGNLLNLRDELGNLGGATEVKQKTQVGSDEFVELELPSDQIMSQPGPNKLRDMKTAHGGDLVEKEFFKNIRKILEDADEEFAIFHSYELFKFNLNDRGNKLAEKDFILVNFTHRYVCGIEVKRTISGPSVSNKGKPIKGSMASSANQLKGTKASLETWFNTELGNHWQFFSMVYCHSIDANISICGHCSKHIITGKL